LFSCNLFFPKDVNKNGYYQKHSHVNAIDVPPAGAAVGIAILPSASAPGSFWPPKKNIFVIKPEKDLTFM
jgi:hypothetical protein